MKTYALLLKRSYSPKYHSMQTLVLAAVLLPVMLVIDLLWIGVIGAGFYKAQLGSMLRPDVVWPAAIAFYVIFAFALIFFVVSPALAANASLVRVLLTAAFFGLAAYAAYDLSNLATLKGWPLTVTLVDLVWGMFFTAVSAGITYFVATTFLGY